MKLTPQLRKLALTSHVVSSVGWFGAATAYTGLGVAALLRGDFTLTRATYLAFEPLTWCAIVPLAVASLITGIVPSLGTEWGLFKHYWVVFKLALTLVATIILVANARTVDVLAKAAATGADVGVAPLRGQMLHAVGGVSVLLVTTALAVYKPRGLTRYGWRKLHARRASPSYVD